MPTCEDMLTNCQINIERQVPFLEPVKVKLVGINPKHDSTTDMIYIVQCTLI
jgi:hypothetical protein